MIDTVFTTLLNVCPMKHIGLCNLILSFSKENSPRLCIKNFSEACSVEKSDWYIKIRVCKGCKKADQDDTFSCNINSVMNKI